MRQTKTYQALPYNPALRNKARALRKSSILHEALLWRELKSQKLNGMDLDRQKIIGDYIVDFYCAEKSIVIEVDGSSHDHKPLEDASRDNYLESLGLTVIRLLAKDVFSEYAECRELFRKPPRPYGHPSKRGELG